MDTCSLKLSHYSFLHIQCMIDTQMEVFFEKGKQRLFDLYSTSIAVGVIIQNVQSGTSSCSEDLWIFGVIAVMCLP